MQKMHLIIVENYYYILFIDSARFIHLFIVLNLQSMSKSA